MVKSGRGWASTRSGWVAGGAALAAAAVVTGALVFAAGGDRSGPATSSTTEGASRSAVIRYEEALEPLAREAGRAVVQGLHGALADLSDDAPDVESVLDDLTHWRGVLASLADRMESLTVPDSLAPSVARRRTSMDLYVEVTATLIEAARASGEQREELLDRAVELGKEADRAWERADDLLNRERHRVGLPTTTTFVSSGE